MPTYLDANTCTLNESRFIESLQITARYFSVFNDHLSSESFDGVNEARFVGILWYF